MGDTHSGGTAVSFSVGNDRLRLDPGAGSSGLVLGGAGVTTLELAAGHGSIAALGVAITGFTDLVFDSAAAWTVGGSAAAFTGTISGFAADDTLDVTGLADTIAAYADGLLTLAGSALLTLQFAGLVGAGSLAASPDRAGGTDIALARFATGTYLATVRGGVVVEALRVGDRVLTVSGRLAPDRWIGHRATEPARHPRPHDIMPVRIRAGALGNGLPLRDLVLSPDHALLLDGRLVPVRHLINGVSIVQERRDRVTYWHVKLDRHGILLAEGLAVESYLDTGNRAAFEGEAVLALLADFAPALAVWPARDHAAILTDPATASLRAIHTALLARGVQMTSDSAIATRQPAPIAARSSG